MEWDLWIITFRCYWIRTQASYFLEFYSQVIWKHLTSFIAKMPIIINQLTLVSKNSSLGYNHQLFDQFNFSYAFLLSLTQWLHIYTRKYVHVCILVTFCCLFAWNVKNWTKNIKNKEKKSEKTRFQSTNKKRHRMRLKNRMKFLYISYIWTTND